LIACEDTRQSQKLLNHYGIGTRTTSYHEHNEADKAHDLVAQLARGTRIALITDAGMPGVSDPGYRVVSLAIQHSIPVIPIPGASAFVSALAASGLPTDAFQFNGFLPAKQGQRRQAFEDIRNSNWTQAFYEAPHRMMDSLQDAVEILGAERNVVIARELTKIHEEFLRGTAAEVLKTLSERGNVKGEIVLLIRKATTSGSDPAKVSVRERMKQLMTHDKLDEKAALKRVAKEIGVSKSDVYREWQRKGPRSS
jgi:16S rRNA (cytidine1402-2'-O)-methyltransferase